MARQHFILNNQEAGRFGANAVVDERTLMELYAAPFESAVAAGVGSVMCAYNRVTALPWAESSGNGSWACEDGDTLQRVLKDRFAFSGWVMSGEATSARSPPPLPLFSQRVAVRLFCFALLQTGAPPTRRARRRPTDSTRCGNNDTRHNKLTELVRLFEECTQIPPWARAHSGFSSTRNRAHTDFHALALVRKPNSCRLIFFWSFAQVST